MEDNGLRPAAALVDAARAGDGAAIERLLRTAWAHAFRISLMILKDRSLAEDAAQEASISAGLQIHRLRDGAAFSKWFFRITVRQAIRLLPKTPETLPLSEVAPVPVSAPSEILELRTSILGLPLALRAPLVLATYCGLTGEEIGALLNISTGAVRFRVWRAKQILRDQLFPKDEAKQKASVAI